MWETIKKALTGITEATGFEIPGLPVDLGAVGDAATTGVETLTESAAGLTESASGVIESATGAAGTISETTIGDVLPK